MNDSRCLAQRDYAHGLREPAARQHDEHVEGQGRIGRPYESAIRIGSNSARESGDTYISTRNGTACLSINQAALESLGGDWEEREQTKQTKESDPAHDPQHVRCMLSPNGAMLAPWRPSASMRKLDCARAHVG